MERMEPHGLEAIAGLYHGIRRSGTPAAQGVPGDGESPFAQADSGPHPEEALSRLILFGERALGHALNAYVTHYHEERPQQGEGNVILLPTGRFKKGNGGPIHCRERLGGLLKFYKRDTA
jgi:hypothetical protein